MRFVMIGFGYISIRHLKAIKETGNELVAVFDPHNAAGVLDAYFPECKFFSIFEEFDLFVKLEGNIRWCSICSPNYLHETHIQWALWHDLQVICEKPIVTNSKAFDKIPGDSVYPILQLRIHPTTDLIRKARHRNPIIHVKYHTPRGDWYHKSWKGDISKSGGVVMNIGVHLVDLVEYLYGLKNCNLTFDLSTDCDKACREFTVNGKHYSFDEGFSELHTDCYRRS